MHARQPALRLAVAVLLLAGCGSITAGGNAEASADSIREVLAFFDQHLAPGADRR